MVHLQIEMEGNSTEVKGEEQQEAEAADDTPKQVCV